MILPYFELVIMTILGAIASLFLKKASGSASVLYLLKNYNFYAGGFLYAISGVINIWILRFLDYSVVLPLTSLTYVWTMFLSYFLLSEDISKRCVVGILLIFLGATLVSL